MGFRYVAPKESSWDSFVGRLSQAVRKQGRLGKAVLRTRCATTPNGVVLALATFVQEAPMSVEKDRRWARWLPWLGICAVLLYLGNPSLTQPPRAADKDKKAPDVEKGP